MWLVCPVPREDSTKDPGTVRCQCYVHVMKRLRICRRVKTSAVCCCGLVNSSPLSQSVKSTPKTHTRHHVRLCFRRKQNFAGTWIQSPSFTTMDEKAAGVECDVCSGRKRKAEQSCLECQASFCGNHTDLHGILRVGKRHKLVAATGSLKDSICPEHGKLMRVFCRKDQQCICHLCITNKHKNHDVVLIKDEVPEKRVWFFFFLSPD